MQIVWGIARRAGSADLCVGRRRTNDVRIAQLRGARHGLRGELDETVCRRGRRTAGGGVVFMWVATHGADGRRLACRVTRRRSGRERKKRNRKQPIRACGIVPSCTEPPQLARLCTCDDDDDSYLCSATRRVRRRDAICRRPEIAALSSAVVCSALHDLLMIPGSGGRSCGRLLQPRIANPSLPLASQTQPEDSQAHDPLPRAQFLLPSARAPTSHDTGRAATEATVSTPTSCSLVATSQPAIPRCNSSQRTPISQRRQHPMTQDSRSALAERRALSSCALPKNVTSCISAPDCPLPSTHAAWWSQKSPHHQATRALDHV